MQSQLEYILIVLNFFSTLKQKLVFNSLKLKSMNIPYWWVYSYNRNETETNLNYVTETQTL